MSTGVVNSIVFMRPCLFYVGYSNINETSSVLKLIDDKSYWSFRFPMMYWCLAQSIVEREYSVVPFSSNPNIFPFLFLEPFLSLSTSSYTIYSILISAFQELHHDLTRTDPSDLLNVEKPAFTVSQEPFNLNVWWGYLYCN